MNMLNQSKLQAGGRLRCLSGMKARAVLAAFLAAALAGAGAPAKDVAETRGPVRGDGINHFYNGGFELQTVPGYLDGWGPYATGLPGHRKECSYLMDSHVFVAADSREAFEGRTSMRVQVPREMKRIRVREPYLRTLPPETPVVWSAWMKGWEGGSVQFSLESIRGRRSYAASQTFRPTLQWKRYEFHYTTGPDSSLIQPLVTVDGGEGGTAVWFDAMKLETGTVATDYTPGTETHPTARSAGPGAGAGETQRYEIPLLPAAPDPQKEPDQAAWKGALELDRFLLVKTGTPVTEGRTSVRLGISGTTLYAAFDCRGASRPPLSTERDSLVFTDECVELFIDPGNPATATDTAAVGEYYHIAVNAAGAVYDVCHGAGARPFDGVYRTSARRRPDGWDIVVAVDLASLNLHPVTRDWRMNLAREDQTLKQCSCIAACRTSFHDHAAFPRFRIPAETAELLNRYAIRPPELERGRLAVRIEAARPGKARVACGAEARTELLRQGINRLEFAPPPERTAVLTVSDADGARAYLAFPTPRPAAPMFRRDYYLVEPEAELLWGGRTLPEKGEVARIGRARVPLSVRDGRVFADISGVQEGRGELVWKDLRIPFAKLAPLVGAVQIDRLQNMLLVDGAGFIPYGPYLVSWWPVDRFLSEFHSLPYVAEHGANLVNIDVLLGDRPGGWRKAYMDPDVGSYRAALDACARLGLKCGLLIHDGTDQGAMAAGYQEINRVEDVVKAFRRHPALLYWSISDEPIAADRELIWRRYRTVRELDPYHPVVLNLTSSGLASKAVTDPRTGRNPMEIISLTYYPCGNCMTGPEEPIGSTDFLFELMGRETRRMHGVMVHAAQAFGYGSDHWTRDPAPWEVPFLVYMPLIHGNRGWWWFGEKSCCIPTQAAIESFGGEVAALAPVLAGSEPVNGDRALAAGGAVALLRRYQGDHFLIAVNRQDRAVTAAFDLRRFLPPGPARAEVWFEGRTADLAGGVLTDRFERYARHVYRICGVPAGKKGGRP